MTLIVEFACGRGGNGKTIRMSLEQYRFRKRLIEHNKRMTENE